MQVNEPTVLGTCQIQVATDDMQPFMLRTSCDTGSQMNLVTTSVVRKLDLMIRKSQTKLVGVEGSPQKSNGFAFLPLQLPGNAESYFEKFYVVGRVTCRLPFQHISLQSYPELHNLKFADPSFSFSREK